MANLDLQLLSLRSDAVKQLEPATINFGLRLQRITNSKWLEKFSSRAIQPVQIDAQLPLNLSS